VHAKFEIPVALEAFIASKEVLVRRPAPPGIRPFLEINGQYRFFFFFFSWTRRRYEAANACYSSSFQWILAIKGSIQAPRRGLQHVQARAK